MSIATSSTAVKRRPPLLMQTLPTTQAQWIQFVTQMQEWYASLQSAQFPPNVLPAQYSICDSGTLAPYTETNCTVTQDATNTLYAADSLKVVVSAAGATLAFTGYPIAMQPNQLWFCAFRSFGAFSGSIALHTVGGTILQEHVDSGTQDGWTYLYTLMDLTACPDGRATFVIGFNGAGTYWLDGLQMSPAGTPFLGNPPFVVGSDY